MSISLTILFQFPFIVPVRPSARLSVESYKHCFFSFRYPSLFGSLECLMAMGVTVPRSTLRATAMNTS
jgi:hypothetical protein